MFRNNKTATDHRTGPQASVKTLGNSSICHDDIIDPEILTDSLKPKSPDLSGPMPCSANRDIIMAKLAKQGFHRSRPIAIPQDKKESSEDTYRSAPGYDNK
jgi:hypothetical protein